MAGEAAAARVENEEEAGEGRNAVMLVMRDVMFHLLFVSLPNLLCRFIY